MKRILNTSITILLWKRLYRLSGFIVHRVRYIYHNSQTHRLINRFWKKIKICFRYSFLGSITEIKQSTPLGLDDSRMVQYLISIYKKWKDKIIHYIRTILTIALVKDTEEKLNFSPVRIISMIVITAITVNVVLSFVFLRQIGLWSWLMRGFFLFAAVSGLFCKADWPTVKRSSVFLKKMRMY